MDKEEWRDIKGYEGLYQVSNLGRVKSLERTAPVMNGSKRTVSERILKQIRNRGYLQVHLGNGSGKMKTFKVHRLACEAFHENSQNKPEVNHINEDKSDNRACNLEWVSRKENNNHGTHNAKVAKALGKPVGQYAKNGKLIKVWQSTREVERRLGVSSSHISKVARGKRKVAYGYVWKYIKEKDNEKN